jgi:hypothetical protein
MRERMAEGQRPGTGPSDARFEPARERGTLSGSDMQPQWQGPAVRNTY